MRQSHEKYYKCKLFHVTILEGVPEFEIRSCFLYFPIADVRVQIHQIQCFAEKYSNMFVNTWSRFPPHQYTKVLVCCCEIVRLYRHCLLVLTHSIFITSHNVIYGSEIFFNQDEDLKRIR